MNYNKHIKHITQSESDSESWIAALVLAFFAKFMRSSGISTFPADCSADFQLILHF